MNLPSCCANASNMFKTNGELLASLPLVSGNLVQLLRFWHKWLELMPVLDTTIGARSCRQCCLFSNIYIATHLMTNSGQAYLWIIVQSQALRKKFKATACSHLLLPQFERGGLFLSSSPLETNLNGSVYNITAQYLDFLFSKRQESQEDDWDIYIKGSRWI